MILNVRVSCCLVAVGALIVLAEKSESVLDKSLNSNSQKKTAKEMVNRSKQEIITTGRLLRTMYDLTEELKTISRDNPWITNLERGQDLLSRLATFYVEWQKLSVELRLQHASPFKALVGLVRKVSHLSNLLAAENLMRKQKRYFSKEL